MYYAVALFDRKLTREIRKIWKKFAHLGIGKDLYHSISPPHISLVGIDPPEGVTPDQTSLGFLTEPLQAHGSRIPVKCTSTGSFISEQNVLYLSPQPSERLQVLQKYLFTLFKQQGWTVHSYYEPERWTPHTTIAIDFTQDQHAPAMQIAGTLKKAPEGFISAVQILEETEYRGLYKYKLKD